MVLTMADSCKTVPQVADKNWYAIPAAELFTSLESNPHGLSTEEARQRLETYGYNELRIRKPSAWMRLLRQLHNALVYILLVAIALTGALGMWVDMSVIVGVVALNVIIGFFQEGKAEASLDALKRTLILECTVLRDGKPIVIPARELVPGDVVVLAGGDRVPADLRLFRARNAHAEEAALTGESVPVAKHTEVIDKPNLSPGDQRCMAFSGTFFTQGTASGLVVATSIRTEIGKIATLLKQTHTVPTPLQRKITDFTRVLIFAILTIGALNFALGMSAGFDWVYNFLGSVSLIVAAIPEMLPMIVTGILALAATRMAKRNALIRRLPAAETLGCTSVICSDKTGTLTKNEMTVIQVLCSDDQYKVGGVGYQPEGTFSTGTGEVLDCDTNAPAALKETLIAGMCCNDASLVRGDIPHIIGDPTEGALLVSAAKAGLDQVPERLDVLPFDSERMLMATLHRGTDNNLIYVKGSPEVVVDLCKHQLGGNGLNSINPDELHDKSEKLAEQALRLLAMASKTVSKEQTLLSYEDLHELTFLGIQGMIDPPRQEAITAVAQCKTAGIRPVMITGDHALTASAIALQLGIIDNRNAPVIRGEELATMDDDALFEAVENVCVYARVAPKDKLRIAQQLQHHDHVVAMTGDGVNDAPALKAADIGIAMGITGTEVSKEASSMVLTDDNFASIVGAVEEGRHAWKNLEKAILYTLPTNGGQALLVIGAVLLAPFVPIFSARLTLEPVMILWINLFDSVFLTMPLMMEAKERHLLKTPPRAFDEKLANSLLLMRVILIGFAIAIPGFLIYHYFGAAAVAADGTVLDPTLLSQAQTAAFWAVLMVHFGFVMSARSIYQSAFTFSPFSNKWLWGGIAASLLLRLLPSFVPAVAVAFRTEPFPLEWWIYILPCLLPGFITLETEKFIRRWWSGRNAS